MELENKKKPYIIDGVRLTKDEYNNIKFDTFLTRVPKGKKEILQAHAAKNNEALNAFVNRAIDEAMERDN